VLFFWERLKAEQMRMPIPALAIFVALLSGAAAAEPLANDQQAWSIAAQAGVEHTGWRLVIRDKDLAVFLRTQPEQQGRYWVTTVHARFGQLKTELIDVFCDDRSVQTIREKSLDLRSQTTSESGGGPRNQVVRTSARDMVVDQVCGPRIAAP
jgi:hypothetical protein